jgi:hypothetical protein
MSCMERLGGEEDEHPELGRHHRLVRTGSAVGPRRQLLPQQVEQLVQVDMLISRNTVEAHLVAIYRKQGVSSSGRAVLAARQRGVLPGDQEATSAGEL